jgi:hypothetical protein
MSQGRVLTQIQPALNRAAGEMKQQIERKLATGTIY